MRLLALALPSPGCCGHLGNERFKLTNKIQLTPRFKHINKHTHTKFYMDECSSALSPYLWQLEFHFSAYLCLPQSLE